LNTLIEAAARSSPSGFGSSYDTNPGVVAHLEMVAGARFTRTPRRSCSGSCPLFRIAVKDDSAPPPPAPRLWTTRRAGDRRRRHVAGRDGSSWKSTVSLAHARGPPARQVMHSSRGSPGGRFPPPAALRWSV